MSFITQTLFQDEVRPSNDPWDLLKSIYLEYHGFPSDICSVRPHLPNSFLSIADPLFPFFYETVFSASASEPSSLATVLRSYFRVGSISAEATESILSVQSPFEPMLFDYEDSDYQKTHALIKKDIRQVLSTPPSRIMDLLVALPDSYEYSESTSARYVENISRASNPTPCRQVGLGFFPNTAWVLLQWRLQVGL